MTLAGASLTNSDVNICLVAPSDGSGQGEASETLQNTAHDQIRAAFATLAQQYPRELTVLTLTPQLPTAERHRISLAADAAALHIRFTINHVQAYVAGMAVEELQSETRLIFIQVLPTVSFAQLVDVQLQQGERRLRTIRTVAINSPGPLHEIVSHLVKWTNSNDHPLHKLVLLYPPTHANTDIYIALSTLQCPITQVYGAELAQGAAAYAFAHLSKLREEEEEEMVTALLPTPISVLTADGAAVPIFAWRTYIPAYSSVTFTTACDNQTRVSIGFILGIRAHNDTFARVVLDGLRPRKRGEARIRVSLLVTYDEGSEIVVEQTLEGEPSEIRTVIQIPDPFLGRTPEELSAYDVKGTTHIKTEYSELPDYD
jgi:hypothetical protein